MAETSPVVVQQTLLTQAQRVDRILGVLEKTIEQIAVEVKNFRQRAKSERLFHTWFSASLAILGVASPALVTYQIRLSSTPVSPASGQSASQALGFLAILLTAIVGAAGALQATFRWSDRFRRTSLTALALAELESSARLELFDLRDTQDELKVYQRAYALNEQAQRKLQRIVRKHIEGEVALVAPEGDLQSPKEPKHEK